MPRFQSQCCTFLSQQINDDSMDANILWRMLLKRDYRWSDETINQYLGSLALKKLYLMLRTNADFYFSSPLTIEGRGKYSLLGFGYKKEHPLSSPGNESVGEEATFCEKLHIQPFWILHLHHVNNRTRYTLIFPSLEF